MVDDRVCAPTHRWTFRGVCGGDARGFVGYLIEFYRRARRGGDVGFFEIVAVRLRVQSWTGQPGDGLVARVAGAVGVLTGTARRRAAALRSGGLHEDFAGGGEAEREGASAVLFRGDEAGGEVAFAHADGFAREEAVLLGELEELGRLVGDAHDAQGFFHDAGGEGGVDLRVEFALTARDRIAVGIGLRVAEQGVEAIEDFVGNGVFELLGLGVDGGPVHLEDVDEEAFDEAVLAEDVESDAAAFGGEADALARAVFNVAGVGEGLDHGGHGAGHNGQRLGERTHRHEFSATLGKQEHVLQVIFNSARGHVGVIVQNRFEATKVLF